MGPRSTDLEQARAAFAMTGNSEEEAARSRTLKVRIQRFFGMRV